MNMNARGAMNLQQQSNTAMSREELPNRGIHGGSLPSQSQPQSRNHPSQLHGINHSMMMDPDSQLAREITRKRISLCLQGSQIPRGWMPKLPEIIRFLDERLFRMSSSKEDYMNKDTLVHRINMILKSMNSRNQRLPPQVSSSAIGTMIPTPGVPHGGSMNLAVSGSADCSMISSPYSGSALGTTTGTNILQTLNGAAVIGQSDPLNSSNGIYPDSHHQSSSIKPMDSGRNIALNISLASSQMIPTPGLNNSQSVVLNSGGNITGGFSGAESTVVSEQRMKQYAVNYNNHPLHNAGGQFGVASRSNIAHSYELLNNVSASMGKSTQPFSGSSISEGQLSDLSLPAYSQQYHHPAMPNAYATNNLPAASESLELKAELNKVPPTYQSNFQPGQQAMLKQSLKGNPENMDFQSSLSVQDDLLQSQHIQSYQQQQFQQQPSQTYMPFDQLQYMQQTPQNCQQQYEADTITSNQSLMNSSFGKQLKAEHGMEFQNEAILSHAPTEVHPGLHGQYIPDNIVTIPRGNNTISQMSTSETFQPSVQSQDAFSSPTAGSQLRVHLQGRYHSQALKEFGTQEKPSFPQNVQNEFQQKIIGQDIAQGPHLTMERSMSGHAACIANIDAVPLSSNLVSCGNGNSLRRKEYLNQRRLLLFLRHARWCSFPKGKCPEVNCIKIQQLLIHMRRCNRKECGYHLCHNAKVIVKHHHDCQNTTCPVCIPVRNYIAAERNRYPTSTGLLHEMNDSCKMLNGDDGKKTLSNTTPSMTNSEYLQSPYKRMKVEQSSSLISKRENSSIAVSEISQLHSSQEAQAQGSHPIDAGLSLNYEHADKRTETSARRGLEDSKATHKTNGSENGPTARLGGNFTNPIHPDYRAKEEPQLIEKGSDRIEVDVEREMSESSGDHVFETKSGKPKIHGVSLIELFTAEQVREHITGLRQWIGQSKAKVEKNQAMERLMSENSCQLCAVERLSFEPPPIYCTRCGARIKRNATYYTSGTSDTRQYVCVPCCNEVRGDIIKIEGSSIPKSKLEKKKNDEDLDEPWVQCGKCEAWQHQVCALFNSRRDDKGQAEYTCPNCYAQEIERGDRQPLPQSAVLGAADLPRTLLSDHLEQRLFKQLMKERQERASHLGKSFDEVPGAEELVIRVVSSVDKKVEVKQHFHDIFQEQNYPTEFPYKSKVILLFQRIEGVEVCLFGMYVQEFGSECQFPNQRRVYLSYLDSVKYFRPEMRTVAGEALRTFVYHEILIGYLEYCKRRGFTSCYIWACPPLKGEDYILYCHPEIQKTPKSDKLRDWYLSMLRKATRENIVVGLTNLYDHFFLKVGECKANVTAARLPYFDGDYWPGAAEDLISEFLQEEERQKKGKTKKTITKRALRAAGHADLSDNASKDALLMQKLGETIYPMKEDFIMVHLQHACTHCCLLMVSGTRWVCSRCKNFQLCGKCYDEERKLEERIRHPVNSKEKHVLNPVEIDDVPLDTNDKDEILESEYFDTRQAFLGLCQGNHYQYDTLRRAKHSSMMVLYHLHNPAAPAFVTSCAVCNNDIDAGQGWRCDVCPDFEVCNHCYQKERGTNHPHKLTNLPSMVNAQNTEARQKSLLQSGALQVRKILDLLVHASQCRLISPQHQCQYPLCIKVKGLFLHSKNCKTRAAGGCKQCKKIWHLLWLHGRACKESKCPVPRCKDMKEHFRNMNEHLRRQQNQSESRRRAAVMEMMRQRNAEVVVNSG